MTNTQKKEPRIYVNLFGAPLLLAAIYFGDIYFIGLFSIISFFCIYEFNNLCNKMDYQLIQFIPYTALGLITISKLNLIEMEILQIVLIAIIMGMILTTTNKLNEPINSVSISIFSTIWIGLFLLSVINIRDIESTGKVITIVMFVSVWICDSAAYVFGKQFGNKKIAPSISPKKTWVGSVAGLSFTLLFLLSFYWNGWLGYNLSLSITILLGFIFGGISQFGDLFESKFKRIAKIKDSSQLLQGHGGFLDRFDSLLITAPATLFILNFQELI